MRKKKNRPLKSNHNCRNVMWLKHKGEDFKNHARKHDDEMAQCDTLRGGPLTSGYWQLPGSTATEMPPEG